VAWPHTKSRVLVTGCNWTPSLGYDGDPFANLDTMLTRGLASDKDPVFVAVHLAYPAVVFTDTGKTELELPFQIKSAVSDAINKVTKDWTKQRTREERRTSTEAQRADRLTRKRGVSIVTAVAENAREAYLIASAGGSLPANARQIFYPARPHILERTGKTLLDAAYFQRVLIAYMAKNPTLTADWDVVFDDRGSFVEPHTDHEIGLGTVAVRDYLNECKKATIETAALKDTHVSTRGPNARYSGILLIEKEGFEAILTAVKLAERFDLAIMSSKGLQTVAARKIAEAICSKYDIPLYVLHDFDKNGMAIAALAKRSNERYTFTRKFKVIDLGLRLTDVEKEKLLGSVEAAPETSKPETRAKNLRKNGATEAEVEFLLERRVELNALPSDRFVAYVERKLIEAGAHKVVPSETMLAQTYRAIVHTDLAKAGIEQAIAETAKTRVAVPADLQQRVAAYLKANPECPWDEAVTKIVRGEE
jgi:hypothetical protein